MTKYAGRLGAVIFMLASACYAQQAINHVSVQNSTVVNSNVEATTVGANVASTGNFTNLGALNAQVANSLGVGSIYSQLQLLTSGAPLRRGITWAPDPGGDITFWVNNGQQSPRFDFRDNGALYGSIKAGGWFGNVTGGVVASSLLALNGAQITGTIVTNTVNAGTVTASNLRDVQFGSNQGCSVSGAPYASCLTHFGVNYRDLNYTIACFPGIAGNPGIPLLQGYINKTNYGFDVITLTANGNPAQFGSIDCTMTHTQ